MCKRFCPMPDFLMAVHFHFPNILVSRAIKIFICTRYPLFQYHGSRQNFKCRARFIQPIYCEIAPYTTVNGTIIIGVIIRIITHSQQSACFYVHHQSSGTGSILLLHYFFQFPFYNILNCFIYCQIQITPRLRRHIFFCGIWEFISYTIIFH